MQRSLLGLFFILLLTAFISCSVPGGELSGPEVLPVTPPTNPSQPGSELTVTNLFPSENATGVETTALLQWDCSETANMTFEIYNAKIIPNSNPPIYSYSMIASGITDNFYEYGNLDYNTEYEWIVKAIDENGESKYGPLWFFTTKVRDSFDNLQITNTSVTDGAVYQDTELYFSWDCDDLSSNENILYDFYFGTSSSPDQVQSGLTENHFSLENLNHNTTYYWSVTMKGSDGLSKSSPVWLFTTLPGPPAGAKPLLVVIDGLVYDGIETRLMQYRDDLIADNYYPIFLTWYDRSVIELRETVKSLYLRYSLEGAFLIGDIPIARYFLPNYFSSTALVFMDLEIPTDMYLMDMDDSFSDSDQNGVFDSYTQTELEIYISRIKGSIGELNHYFDKVHTYKTSGSLVDKSAYIFTDDDWWTIHGTRSDNLELIYQNLDFCYLPVDSLKANYISKLTGTGAEFVIQEIHGATGGLLFEGGGASLTIADVEALNLKASFYVMHNCSSARFTVDNLGMAYLMKTDYGLAIYGATEATGASSVATMIEKLSQDGTWGEAFIHWYNIEISSPTTIVMRLEKIIYGDPTLVIE